MNQFFIAIYRNFLIAGHGKPWVKEGRSMWRYSHRTKILDLEFKSVDGKYYHLAYDHTGFRPSGYVIPFDIFIRDEAI